MQAGNGGKSQSLKPRARYAILPLHHPTRTVSSVLHMKFGWQKATKRFFAMSKSSHAVRVSGGGSAWTTARQKLSIMRFRIAASSFHHDPLRIHSRSTEYSVPVRVKAISIGVLVASLVGMALAAGCTSTTPVAVLMTCADFNDTRKFAAPPPDARKLRAMVEIDPNLRDLSDYWFTEQNGDITLCRATPRQSCLGEWWTFHRSDKSIKVVGHGGPSCVLLTRP